MTPDDLQELLRKQPFTPLRLHMGNGRTLDVRLPELAVIAGELAAISESKPGGETRLRVVSLININEVEFLPSTTT